MQFSSAKKHRYTCHAWIGIIGAFLRRWRTVTIYAAIVLFIAWTMCWQACFTRTVLKAHARRNQNRALYSGRVALFSKDVVRERQGMGEVRGCKSGVTKVWMIGAVLRLGFFRGS